MVDVLEIQGVIKRYDDKLILSDIYLQIETNQIIGIFGRNGAGKTTLFNILYGIEKCDDCQIRYNNKIITQPFRRKNLICYSTQESFLPKHMNVIDVLRLFYEQHLPSNVKERFQHLLCTKIENLSGGERKLLQLFTILNSKSKFVILDEPFNHLSPIMCEEVKKMIVESSKNKCIIISDHSFLEVLELTHKNYLLSNGSLKKLHSKNDLYLSSYLT